MYIYVLVCTYVATQASIKIISIYKRKILQIENGRI